MSNERQQDHDDQKDHGHARETTIIVNAQPKVVTSKELTYEQVVALAYPEPADGRERARNENSHTDRGEGNKPEGTLVGGGEAVDGQGGDGLQCPRH